MPCRGCGDPNYVGTVKVRYVGKSGDKGSLTFVNGRVYTKPARYANKEAFPYFELVAVMPGTVIPDKYRYVVKRIEVPVETELVEVPVVEDEPEPESEDPVEEEVVEPVEEEVFIEVEPLEADEEIPVIEEGEQVSSIVDASVGLSQSNIFSGMDDGALRAYITAQTGKEPDGRWGLNKLIEEARKLQ